jgi:hypothetical protein
MNGVKIMKYNFVYDTDFLAKNVFNLSKEEVDIVLATIIGKHNAIFYGNKPERLVDAVRLLSHSERFVEQKLFSGIDDGLQNAKEGIMYLKDFDVWSIIEQQFLYGHTLNNGSRCTQFIATTSNNPTEVVVPDVLDNFDIIYKCKENEKPLCYKESLLTKLDDIIDYHNSLHSGHFITSTELELDGYWLWNDAYLYLRDLGKNNPVIARKVSMVSRSVSDRRRNSLTSMDDIHTAEYMCGLRKEEELW